MLRACRRRVWLLVLLLELLLVTGPVVLVQIHIAWLERTGQPIPDNFGYVPWMLGAGFALLIGASIVGLALRFRRRKNPASASDG